MSSILILHKFALVPVSVPNTTSYTYLKYAFTIFYLFKQFYFIDKPFAKRAKIEII